MQISLVVIQILLELNYASVTFYNNTQDRNKSNHSILTGKGSKYPADVKSSHCNDFFLYFSANLSTYVSCSDNICLLFSKQQPPYTILL